MNESVQCESLINLLLGQKSLELLGLLFNCLIFTKMLLEIKREL